MTARKPTALAARLAALDITADELAAIVRRSVEEVDDWVTGKTEPDGEAKILLRIMDANQTHAAQLAAERIRLKVTQGWRGEGAEHAGIDPEKLADNTPPQLDGRSPQ